MAPGSDTTGPYSFATTEDIRAAAVDLNRDDDVTRVVEHQQHDVSVTTPKPTTVQPERCISMDAVRGESVWSFAWVRWFFVRRVVVVASSSKVNASGEGGGGGAASDAESPYTTMPTLKLAYEDCCALNVENLLEQFHLDEAVHGRVNTSMVRICWTLCRTRVLCASLLHLVMSGAWILAIMLCMKNMMEAANGLFDAKYQLKEILEGTNETIVVGYNSTEDLLKQQTEHGHRNLAYCGAYVALMLLIVALKACANSIVLRTAIMLRNACAGAVYQSTVYSSVQTRVDSHQIMALCADDGQAIVELVTKGAFLVAQSLGMVMCIVTGALQMTSSALFGFIGISFIVLLVIVMAMTSRRFQQKSHGYAVQKLNVVEQFFGSLHSCQDVLTMHDAFKKRFAAAVSGQFWALFRAESLRPSFSGALTVYFLLACVIAINMHGQVDVDFSGSVIAMAFLFVVAMYWLMSDWSEAFMAIVQGQLVLDRVQALIARAYPTVMPPKSDAHADRVYIKSATFRWDRSQRGRNSPENNNGAGIDILESPFTLHIDSFRVPSTPTVIGITGPSESGKSSVIHALLGHMPHCGGDFHGASRVAYYPQEPYVLEKGTLRQNICWSNVGAFEEARYNDSISSVQLHLNSGYDQEIIERSELDAQWMQKISLARALYNGNQEIVILRSPLCGFESSTEISDIFADVVAKLVQQGKAVIVVSCDDNILRHCNEVYMLDNGKLNAAISYAEISRTEAYGIVKNEHKQQRLNDRNRINPTTLQTTINISEEDLVCNEPSNSEYVPVIFNPIETFYLIVLCSVNAFMQVALPVSEMLYVHAVHIFLKILFIMLGFMGLLLISNGLVKHYSHRIGRKFVKSLQKDVFKKVLNNTVSDPAALQSHTVYVMNLLLDGNFKAFQTRSMSVYNWTTVVLAIWVAFLYDPFLVFAVAVLPMQFIILYFAFRHTNSAAGLKEIDSRLKLFENIHNDVSNRAALQSADYVLQSRNKIFNLIEDNSAAVYLEKSLVYFVQFLFECIHAVGLPVLFTVLHCDPYHYDYMYVLALYVYYMVSMHLMGLVDLRFTKNLADQKLINVRKFASTNSSTIDRHK